MNDEGACEGAPDQHDDHPPSRLALAAARIPPVSRSVEVGGVILTATEIAQALREFRGQNRRRDRRRPARRRGRVHASRRTRESSLAAP